MQNYSLRQFGRTILTIAGIILLVIFGSRAASQATSVAAVGGAPKHTLLPISLTVSQLVALEPANESHSFVATGMPIGQVAATAPPAATATPASGSTQDSTKVTSLADDAKVAVNTVKDIQQQAGSKVQDAESQRANTTDPQALQKPDRDLLNTEVK